MNYGGEAWKDQIELRVPRADHPLRTQQTSETVLLALRTLRSGETANHYYSVLISAKVPAERVLRKNGKGFGTYGEAEVVVLSNESPKPAVVPVERIFSRSGTGFGVFGEEEVLVMATEGSIDVVTVHLLK